MSLPFVPSEWVPGAGDYLHHVILCENQVRPLHRSEVPVQTLSACRQLLREAQRPGRSALLPQLGEGYRMDCLVLGDNVRCAIWYQDLPLLLVGVAFAAGEDFWKAVFAPACTVPCPPTPWIGVDFQPHTATLQPQILLLAGEFLKGLGFAWLDLCLNRRFRTTDEPCISDRRRDS